MRHGALKVFITVMEWPMWREINDEQRENVLKDTKGHCPVLESPSKRKKTDVGSWQKICYGMAVAGSSPLIHGASAR